MKNTSKTYEQTVHIVEGYLSNYYSYEKLAYHLRCSLANIRKVLDSETVIRNYFGDATIEDLRNHKKFVRCYSHKQDYLFYQDFSGLGLRTLLKCPYDYNAKLTKQQIQSLNILRLCFIHHGNLEEISQILSIKIDSVIAYLSSPFLKDLLSDFTKDYLDSILEKSFLFSSQTSYQRKSYIVFLFESFHQCNGNLVKLCKSTGLSIPVLRFFLSNSYYMMVAKQSDAEIQWIQSRLAEQSELFNDLQDTVEDQILFGRTNILETSECLGISKYKIRKLVKDKIPSKNPVRGVLVSGVLSTLDS